MTSGIFEGLLLAGVAAVAIVSWWGIRRIVESLDSIDSRLGTINGRVGKMETWQVMHERQDDERYEHIDKTTDAIWTAVRSR
jgi:hypothetical protein